MSSDAFHLCHTLLTLGDVVSRNLQLSYGCEISYGEETITESCLLEIWRRHSSIVHVETFTKRQEARNGADWEWHLIGRAYTFKMRVQAKRLARNAGKMRSLFTYKAKSSLAPQVDMLIRGAAAMKLMPVLCFYSPETARRKWTAAKMPLGLEAGCLIGDASKITTGGNNDLTSLEHITVPWHFLACPLTKASSDFPSITLLNVGSDAMKAELPKYIVPTGGEEGIVAADARRALDLEFGVVGRIKIDCRNMG
ncbi:hypothetical protein IB238_01655 [Rhizobium sp. ARZ01]|uniref:DUF6615 family protein n=1 Tax=Rhizobium sp. ARZ01 TaxID=2769313 RepID=UPI00177CA74F|nr:DUF6615 family protein [Rhizobium sp. ARZ01]MBD9371344.1 hypothetical protein [Rhizobium sp. ARZ01]